MNQDECLSYSEYVEVWNKISKETEDDLGLDSHWLLLENAFNKMNKTLLLSTKRNESEGFLRLVLDEDKLHCDGFKE